MMFGKKKSIISMTLVLGLLLAGCGDGETGQSTQGDQDARTQIEALDVENTTHVELQMDDKVLVDADVTPYENYKDGITAYYVDTYRDGASEYTTEAVTESSLLFGKPIEEQIAFLAEYMGAELTYEESEINLLDSQCTIKVPDANEDIAWISWSVKEYGLCRSQLIYPYFNVDYDSMTHGAFETMDLGNYEPKDVSEEIQEEAQEAKDFVSSLTSETLSDYTVCVPLEEAEGDTWTYVFYYELDGLPWMRHSIGLQADEDAVLSDDVLEYTDKGLSDILPMCAASITYQDGSPVQAVIPLFAQTGDVYREQTAVLGLDDVLLKACDYFDSVLVAKDITITNIRLIYNTWYSDGADGEEIRFVAYPFWCLQYYNDTAGYGNMSILFDAYTGDFIAEIKQDF